MSPPIIQDEYHLQYPDSQGDYQRRLMYLAGLLTVAQQYGVKHWLLCNKEHREHLEQLQGFSYSGEMVRI